MKRPSLQALEALGQTLMILLLPIGLFWPMGEPAVDGVLARFVTLGLYVSDAALVILLAAFVWPKREGRWSPVGVTGAVFALAALGFVTAATAMEPRLALYSAGRWLLAAVVFFSFRQEAAPFERLVGLFLATLVVQAAVGLYQVLAQGPLGLPGEMALAPSEVGAAVLRLEGGVWLRPYGLTFHPNVLGGFLAVGIVLAVPWLERRPVRIVWWLFFLGLFLSFSRSAWLAVGVMLPVVLVWRARRTAEGRRALVMAVAGAGAVLLVSAYVWRAPLAARVQPLLPEAIVEGVAGGEADGDAGLPAGPEGGGEGAPSDEASDEARIDPLLSRLEQARVALRVVGDRPWRGVGAGNFSMVMVREAEGEIPQPVHNAPLLLAAEVGVLGAVLWLGLGVLGLYYLASSWRAAGPWAVATTAAWLVLFIISFFDFYPWGLNSGRLLSVFVLGLVARAVWRARRLVSI